MLAQSNFYTHLKTKQAFMGRKQDNQSKMGNPFLFSSSYMRQIMLHACLLNELNYCRMNSNCFESLICVDKFSIEGQDYLDSVTMLMQEGERLQLLGGTKFTARKYFDLLLSHSPRVTKEDLIPMVVGCLRTAVKQCESQAVSEMYTIKYALEQSGDSVEPYYFVQIELRIMSILNMKMKLVTPYDYLGMVKQLFPEKDMTLTELTCIIDFFLIQPELTKVTAEELFFAALLYNFNENRALPISYQIAKALTCKWEEAVVLNTYLVSKLQKIAEQ